MTGARRTITVSAEATKRVFTASVWQEGDWDVAQALDADVASQGKSENDALANLREALELHFEPPVPSTAPGADLGTAPDTPSRHLSGREWAFADNRLTRGNLV